jgi:hypothetical protein
MRSNNSHDCPATETASGQSVTRVTDVPLTGLNSQVATEHPRAALGAVCHTPFKGRMRPRLIKILLTFITRFPGSEQGSASKKEIGEGFNF